MNFEVHDELCSGCCSCRLVCALANLREVNPSKAVLSIIAHFPSPGTYEIRLCSQCGDCARVCPVEAITDRNGIFLIDDEVCIGCAACVEECQRGVLVMHPDSEIPMKCTSCGECAAVCPRDAIVVVDSH